MRIRFSATDYTPAEFTILRSVGGPIGEKIRFQVLGNPITAGVCLPAVAILENFDGAEVPAASQTTFSVALNPATAGVISVNGNCNTNESSLTFGPNQSRVNFYVQYFVANTSVAFTIPGGMLSPVGGGAITVGSNPTESMADYIYLQLPDFNQKEVIGTHEFTDLNGTAKLIPIIAPPGSTFECSEDEVSWGNCGAHVQNNNFVWTKTRATAVAAADRDFYIRRVGYWRRIEFNPQLFWGSEFRVINCDHIQTANINFVPLVANFNAQIKTVCLGPGVTISKTMNNESHGLETDQKIIGSVAGTSVIDYANYTRAEI